MFKTAGWLIAALCVLCMGAARAAETEPSKASDADQFRQLFLPPDLLLERFRARLARNMVAGVLADEYALLVAGRVPTAPGTYTDRDLQQFLLEIDRLARKYTAPLNPAAPDMVAAINKKLLAIDLSGSRLFFNDEAAQRKLIIENRDFMIKTAMLPTYHEALIFLAPGVVERRSMLLMPTNYDDRYHLPLYEIDADGRLVTDVMLNTKRAMDLLPAKYDVARLRRQDDQIEAASRADAMLRRNLIGEPFPYWVLLTAEGEVDDQFRKQFKAGGVQEEGYRADIDLLRERIRLAADPQVTGFCDRLTLNSDTVKASGGDWTQVRTKDNAPLRLKAPGEWDFNALIGYYLRGCYVKKDLAIARKLLEIWANGHGDKFKVAMHTHCTMALWTRYGVGGKRDAKAAAKWEARALEETGVACPALSLIDPRDPWADLH